MIDLDISTMPLVYLDVETTGFSSSKCRMIEVAAIRIENGKVTSKLTSFLQIDEEVPEVITKITGIVADDLKNAPVFSHLTDAITAILSGAVLVAHNAKFDYSFLKAEFERAGKEFTAITLCTVEVAKALYPQLPNHKLQTLIEHHKIETKARHRAEDDAQVLVELLGKAYEEFGTERVIEVARRALV